MQSTSLFKQTFSVLHVDDHEIVRIGVRTVVNRMPHFNMIEEDVADGTRAMILLSRLRPDILILDIDMPGASGIEVARHVQLTHLPTKVILLSNAITHYTFEECLSLNVMGFLTKSASLSELKPCLIDVIDNKSYISTDCLNGKRQFVPAKSNLAQKLTTVLSKTEIKVLKLISIGKSTSEIAEEMFKSTRTIDSHRYHMSQKLNIKGKNGLLCYAFQNKSVILGLDEAPQFID